MNAAGRVRRCCSSVVEHSLGKGEVESSIPSSSTSPTRPQAARRWRQSSPNDVINGVIVGLNGRYSTDFVLVREKVQVYPIFVVPITMIAL